MSISVDDILESFDRNSIKNKKKSLTADQLLRVQKDREKKLKDHYERVYIMCEKRIRNANRMNIKDIIYDVPIARFMCPDYNSRNCLEKIKDRLDEMYMDTLIMSDTTIFISWKNLEKNREDQENSDS